MSGVLLSVRIVLAGVFLLAGVTKLLDRGGSRRALEDFGAPVWAVGFAALALPVTELMVAAGLLVSASAVFAAGGALALLALFTGAIIVAIARGRAPDCHCFGQVHVEQVGWSTAARNGLLAVAAGFVVVAGWSNAGTSATRWIVSVDAGWLAAAGLGVALAVVLVSLGAFCVQLLRQNGRVLERLDALEQALAGDTRREPLTVERHEPRPAPAPGLPVGSAAPEFALPALDGRVVDLAGLRAAGNPVLLVFSNPGCGPCGALLPEVAAWQSMYRDRLTIAVLSEGSLGDNRAKSAEHAVSNVLLCEGQRVSQGYRALGTPTAVLVSADGRVGSPVAGGADAIRALVRTSTVQPGPRNGAAPVPPAPRPGDPASPFALRDVHGDARALPEYRGREVLVLAWNPRCGFCERMLEDLRAWDARRPPEAAELLVLSAGDPRLSRGMGLRSPVLIDEGGAAAASLGLRGTPMAVLVDGAGRISSEIASGASAVLALAAGSSGAQVPG